MNDLHVGVEEFSAAMGAAKDDFIGDAHGYLRDVDEKMPGHGNGKARWVTRRQGLLEFLVIGHFCGSVPLKRRRRSCRPKYSAMTNANSKPTLITSDMIETHTETAPNLMKPSAKATTVANIQNIGLLIDVGRGK